MSVASGYHQANITSCVIGLYPILTGRIAWKLMIEPEIGKFGRGVSKIDPIKMHLKHHTSHFVGVWISSTTWMRWRRVLACPIGTTDPRVERKQIIHFRRHVNQSPHTQVSLVSDGRKDESPPTRVLYTKMGYQKKRKTALYPLVSTVAIEIHHGDLQGTARLGDGGGLGFLPLRLGDFPKVGKLDCFGKCSTLVC